MRLENLKSLLSQGGLTPSALARSIGVSSSAVSQYVAGRRKLGRAFCARIETALGLQRGCMDFQGMQIPDSALASTSALHTGVPLQGAIGDSSLHTAVVEAFLKAARAGAVSDAACAELIVRFIAMRSAPSGFTQQQGSRIDLAGAVARLRLRGVVMLHVGDAKDEELLEHLATDFGPEAAQGIRQHVFELREAPISESATKEVYEAINRGLSRW